ncbi:MAG: phosphoglycerate dehydrogenase, partial [Acidimicrobiia bacterium]|nr:phosphoglycerate dehydrogenase [Acidimicrobiia bacterium]
MARILVTETIAASGLDRLRAAGHDVDVRTGLSDGELLGALAGAHALIIRSATHVTDVVLAAGTDLLVVGRAGIGLDNVDIAAATRRGVMVVNAPQSNILSAAEHTMALLLAQARNIPQAHRALKDGRWERSKWEGVELAEKTLGIVGLGRIGKLVAERAKAFGMRLIAFDPYISSDRARQFGVELADLDAVVCESDFLTIHLPRTTETEGLISRDLLLKARPTLRVINVARGGIVDEAALAECIRDGVIAGAALDVFEKEPTTVSPLFDLPSVVVTPHLGASTREAQDKAGDTIADMVQLALAGEFVPYAVNISAAEASETLRPYLPLAERLGRLFASLVTEAPSAIEISVEGEIGG